MRHYVKLASALALLLAVLPFGIASADEHDADDDLVLEVVDDPDAGEEDYVEEIRLPEQASDQARESAAGGIETANEARERGRDFGQERAEQARELGREVRDGRGRPEGVGVERDEARDLGSAGRERGEENRGNRGRPE
jgi:hypothetical protein